MFREGMVPLSVGIAHWRDAHELMSCVASAPRYNLRPTTMEGITSPNREGGLSQSDEVLMKQYQRGSEPAFRMLYERHRSPLLRFVRRLAPGADVEEIAQETWMAVIKGRERFVPQARFATYLYSIARRRIVDRWRRLGRLLDDPGTEALDSFVASTQYEPENQAENADLGVALLLAIDALPLVQREAFLLRAEGGLSIDEIAAVTGANRETAKSRLRFALSRLRSALEPWHDD
jgi:RNA polymerase sigma-70 factor, ECF subfamily